MRSHPTILRQLALAGALALAAPLHAGELAARQSAPFRIAGAGEAPRAVEVVRDRGFAAVRSDVLVSLGWRVERQGPAAWRLTHPRAPEVRLAEDVPFFRMGEARLQVADPPYASGGSLHVPLQLLADVLPSRLPALYAFEDGVLRLSSGDDGRAAPAPRARATTARPEPASTDVPRDARRVVVIDPGHGGDDPGALGPGGAREKDVALRVALALAAELRRHPELEVHLTRETDVLVPLWERGLVATEHRGDRPGVFISLHANALPGRRSVRGFETYFLSEARTDDERRVAANENAPLAMPSRDAPEGAGRDLDFILRELRNLDHQHWSSLLAEMVQDRLDEVHPGPDRGVKQGPFAVITNALMPAVLVEIGFITNPDEERLLNEAGFQDEVARALAGATLAFFERYPSAGPEPGGHR